MSWMNNKGQESKEPVLFSYNGYSNRETWATALQLSNDQDLYLFFRGKSAEQIKAGVWEIDFHSSDYTPMSNFVLKDIGDLSKVNWSEVAEALS